MGKTIKGFLMKRNRIVFFVMLVLLASTLVFTACGPKALAKQYVKAETAGNDAKTEAIEKKVEKMSEAGQLIFFEEYGRLSDN
jgi:ABC-type oligopeptide transport system substrate-binding subunit